MWIEYIAFKYKQDKRFKGGINPRTFKYIGDFSKSRQETLELINKQTENGYVYGIQEITHYA